MNYRLLIPILVLTASIAAQQTEPDVCHIEPVPCCVGYAPNDEQQKNIAQELALLRQELALLRTQGSVTIELKDNNSVLNKVYKLLRTVATIYPAALSSSIIMRYLWGKHPFNDMNYRYTQR